MAQPASSTMSRSKQFSLVAKASVIVTNSQGIDSPHRPLRLISHVTGQDAEAVGASLVNGGRT